MEAEVHTGTVLFYNDTRGWGFIKDSAGRDIFFHVTGLENEMVHKNDQVTFKIGQCKDGRPLAIEIIKL